MDNSYNFAYEIKESRGNGFIENIRVQHGTTVKDILKSIEDTGRYKVLEHKIEEGNFRPL